MPPSFSQPNPSSKVSGGASDESKIVSSAITAKAIFDDYKDALGGMYRPTGDVPSAGEAASMMRDLYFKVELLQPVFRKIIDNDSKIDTWRVECIGEPLLQNEIFILGQKMGVVSNSSLKIVRERAFDVTADFLRFVSEFRVLHRDYASLGAMISSFKIEDSGKLVKIKTGGVDPILNIDPWNGDFRNWIMVAKKIIDERIPRLKTAFKTVDRAVAALFIMHFTKIASGLTSDSFVANTTAHRSSYGDDEHEDDFVITRQQINYANKSESAFRALSSTSEGGNPCTAKKVAFRKSSNRKTANAVFSTVVGAVATLIMVAVLDFIARIDNPDEKSLFSSSSKMAIAFWTVFSFLVILTIVSAIITNEFVKRSFDKKVDRNAREEFASVIVKSFYDVKGKDIKSIGLQDLHWRAPVLPLLATDHSFISEVQPSSFSDHAMKDGELINNGFSFAQSESSESSDSSEGFNVARVESSDSSSEGFLFDRRKVSRHNAFRRRNLREVSSSLDEVEDPENLSSQQQSKE